jgi:hypothetical protein
MAQDETAPHDSRSELINVSVWHGWLDRAREILAAHPEVASSDIHTAALLGDFEAVARSSPKIQQMPRPKAVRPTEMH